MIDATPTRRSKRQYSSSRLDGAKDAIRNSGVNSKTRKHRRSYTISDPADFREIYRSTPISLVATPTRGSITRVKDEGENERLRPPASTYLALQHEEFSLKDLMQLPSLPAGWSITHDRGLCHLYSCCHSHSAVISQLRQQHPELTGVLTPAMIEKRLRILDQRLDNHYWAASSAMEESPGTVRRTDSVKAHTSSGHLNNIADAVDDGSKENHTPTASSHSTSRLQRLTAGPHFRRI